MSTIVNRCWWAGDDPLYQAYHDHEWGRPDHEDRKLFEILHLEIFQAGLSWLTILRKRENFRQAFSHWDIQAIAAYGQKERERLLADAGIVRNRRKIDATIENAKRYDDLVTEFGSLDAFTWSFAPKNRPIPKGGYTKGNLPLLIDEAKSMSKALKKSGFQMTGPMTCMSFMQSSGIINDHIASCDLCIY